MLKIRSIYYLLPIRRTMRRKQVGIKGSIETSNWSNGLEDDPWPHLIASLDRIADALERLLKYTEMKL